ncbi:MAG: hypothetical protein ACXV4C_09945 [Halobacteriota archaeon]
MQLVEVAHQGCSIAVPLRSVIKALFVLGILIFIFGGLIYWFVFPSYG